MRIDKEILNARQAAEYLGLSPGIVRKWAREGLLPGHKIHKSWRFVKDDLLAWLKSGSGQGTETQNS
jgi:excisionase family DNA binding protein